MREVSVHRDPAVVGFHKSILESAGIACYVRNEHTSASLGAGMFGMAQSHLFDPVLCIVDDDRFDDAVQLIGDTTNASNPAGVDWKCPKCSEMIPGCFETCWNCAEPEAEP